MIGRVLDDTLVAVVGCVLLGTTMWTQSGSPHSDDGGARVSGVTSTAPVGADKAQFFDREFARALGGRVQSVTLSVAEGMGQRACSAFAEGASAVNVRRVLMQKGVSDNEASLIVLASRVAYCPEHA
jgi:hypothetical protein